MRYLTFDDFDGTLSGLQENPAGRNDVASPGGLASMQHHWTHGLFGKPEYVFDVYAGTGDRYIAGEYGNLYTPNEHASIFNYYRGPQSARTDQTDLNGAPYYWQQQSDEHDIPAGLPRPHATLTGIAPNVGGRGLDISSPTRQPPTGLPHDMSNNKIENFGYYDYPVTNMKSYAEEKKSSMNGMGTKYYPSNYQQNNVSKVNNSKVIKNQGMLHNNIAGVGNTPKKGKIIDTSNVELIGDVGNPTAIEIESKTRNKKRVPVTEAFTDINDMNPTNFLCGHQKITVVAIVVLIIAFVALEFWAESINSYLKQYIHAGNKISWVRYSIYAIVTTIILIVCVKYL